MQEPGSLPFFRKWKAILELSAQGENIYGSQVTESWFLFCGSCRPFPEWKGLQDMQRLLWAKLFAQQAPAGLVTNEGEKGIEEEMLCMRSLLSKIPAKYLFADGFDWNARLVLPSQWSCCINRKLWWATAQALSTRKRRRHFRTECSWGIWWFSGSL